MLISDCYPSFNKNVNESLKRSLTQINGYISLTENFLAHFNFWTLLVASKSKYQLLIFF